jgi:hypothetical protein
MDYFYDGQLRRYVTQFMRIFIGFKYKAGDGEERQIPVLYGDLTRQVASIIRENSMNKLPTVPRMACYITGLEMDTTRLSDPTFVSKIHVRERKYTDAGGTIEYQNAQGGNYTVERLMPTPYTLKMKADIWSSNTDQKLQILEQILVLFNPSLEIQTTDNYIDWTSLSAVYMTSTNFSSRTIPQGAESEIDICSLEFTMPVWITPPAKVKKLGIVQTIINNVFTEEGDIKDLESLIYNRQKGTWGTTTNRFRVLLFKSNTGNLRDGQYDVTVVDPSAAVLATGLNDISYKNGDPFDWNRLFEIQGGYKPGCEIWFEQPTGYEIRGTFVVNPLDPSILVASLDTDTFPSNTDIASSVNGLDSRGTVDAIIDPYKFNPIETFGGQYLIPLGIRYLMLDDVNNSANVGGNTTFPPTYAYDGPDAWKNANGTDPVIKANSIIEWDGENWIELWDPATGTNPTYIQNIRTGIQYKWDGVQWLKSFEGEYAPGLWGFALPS